MNAVTVWVQSAIMRFQDANGRIPSLEDLADLAFDLDNVPYASSNPFQELYGKLAVYFNPLAEFLPACGLCHTTFSCQFAGNAICKPAPAWPVRCCCKICTGSGI